MFPLWTTVSKIQVMLKNFPVKSCSLFSKKTLQYVKLDIVIGETIPVMQRYIVCTDNICSLIKHLE